MGSTLPPHKQVYESRTPLGLDGIGNEVRFPGPCILVKRCRSDTGRLPRGSPHRGVHLEDRRTYPKGGWERFWRYRLGGDLMEYHDGDTESPPDGRIQFHDTVHGFSTDRGTGNTSL